MISGLQVLYFEDNAKAPEHIQATFAAENAACAISRVDTQADFVALLQLGGFDLILADYTPSSFDGISALKLAQEIRPEVPFIFVSATLGEETAIDALQSGATDYVPKTRLSRLASSAQRALREAKERIERERAERALAASEERWRAVFENSSIGVALTDMNGRFMATNAAYQKMLGYSEEELRNFTFLEVTHEDYLEANTKEIAKLKEGTQNQFQIEKQYKRKDGSLLWVTNNVSLIPGSETIPQFIMALSEDITERKQAEELRAAQVRQTALLGDISKAFATGDSLREILRSCTEALVYHFEAAFARIWTLSTGENVLVLQSSSGLYTQLDGTHSRVAVGALKIGLIAQEKKPHLTNDVLNDPRISDKVWARKEGMVAFAGYPLVVEDQTVGVMAMFSRKSLATSTLDTLAGAADLIAQGIERKVAQDRLRESEQELRQLIEGIPQFIWRAAPDGSIEFHNQRLLAYHGRTMDEVRGWGFINTFHPDDRERVLKIRREGVSAAVPFEFETRILGNEGQYRWFLIRGLPLRDSHGSITKWYGACTDIEERKQNEQALQLENAYLQEQVDRQFTEIVGQSLGLKKVLQQIQKVAATDSSVLISGESGTGKELVARAIHDGSRRRDHRMVTVNCASIPRDLFESEFFGHTKGSFTGAIRDRVGRFQLADKGTIFLDEVGEIPFELQSKLLRVLQEGEFERIGEDHARHVDVRVIAATNRDLARESEAGHFRKDLYYRLCVFPIHLPPLRERREDIGLLAAHLLKVTSQRLNFPDVQLTDRALRLLSAYDWPGNIRELQNVIERGIIVTQSGPLRIDLVLGDTLAARKHDDVHVMPRPRSNGDPSMAPQDSVFSRKEMEDREHANTLAALTKSNWKIYGPGGAAEILGIKPTTLASRVKRMGIKRPAS